MTRILVTGGAGYVGAVSVEAFLAAGHDVVVLDDLSTGHRSAVPDGARLIVGDYTDRATAAAVFAEESIDAILHCAARSLIGESIVQPARYFGDNVGGGVGFLEAARTAGVMRFVLSSSAAVYGVPDTTPILEDAPLRPINPYGESKRSLEAAMAWYGRAYGMRTVSLRYFNVAGATDVIGEDHDPETHLIPAILGAVEADRTITIFGGDYPTRDGTNVRDYIDVTDLADAHLRAIDDDCHMHPLSSRECRRASVEGDVFTALVPAKVHGRTQVAAGVVHHSKPVVASAEAEKAREIA